MNLVRLVFWSYLAIRIGEGAELAMITYTVTNHALLVAVSLAAYLFALAVVIDGVKVLGEKIALTWHVILEVLLLFVSIYFAYSGASHPTQFCAAWTFGTRFGVNLAFFLLSQGLLALMGVHALRWLVYATRKTRPRTKP